MYYFIIAFVGILLGFHSIIYFFFSKVFELSLRGKIAFGVILILLSFSYVFSRFLISKWDNIITKSINYLSSLWLGVFFSLLLFILISSLIILLLRIFNINIDLKYFGFLVIISSLVYSSYGLINANKIIVKHQEVKIENIPEKWKQKKAVFFADSHLGHVLDNKFLIKLVSLINKEKPDIIFISGDLFDGYDSDFSYFFEQIKNLNVKDGIYLVEGNHDVYLGGDILAKTIEGTGIKLLEDNFDVVDGLQILGLRSSAVITSEYKLKFILNNLLKKGFNKELPSILLFHEPHYTNILSDFGIDLQLSGHTHDGQLWPLGYFAKIFNYGNGYGLNTNGKFNIYVTNGVGTWGPPLRVGNTPEIVVLKFK